MCLEINDSEAVYGSAGKDIYAFLSFAYSAASPYAALHRPFCVPLIHESCFFSPGPSNTWGALLCVLSFRGTIFGLLACSTISKAQRSNLSYGAVA